MKSQKPLIGVSRCLLGDPVRYDGQAKPRQIIIQLLGDIFELSAICPEVEAGLSVPRPPVQLSGSIERPSLTGRDEPSIDVTDIMQRYCQNKPDELDQLAGFIFKSRSPSCGLNSTPVFIDGERASENSRGVFARAMCKRYPGLPVIEDSMLTTDTIERFITSVNRYHLGRYHLGHL